jgi:hypothetical protein
MAHIQMTDRNLSNFGITEPVNSTIAGELFAQFEELSDEDLQYFVGGTPSLSDDDGVTCVTTITEYPDGTKVTQIVCTYT